MTSLQKRLISFMREIRGSGQFDAVRYHVKSCCGSCAAYDMGTEFPGDASIFWNVYRDGTSASDNIIKHGKEYFNHDGIAHDTVQWRTIQRAAINNGLGLEWDGSNGRSIGVFDLEAEVPGQGTRQKELLDMAAR